jgi:hypothetical protein
MGRIPVEFVRGLAETPAPPHQPLLALTAAIWRNNLLQPSHDP